MTELKPGQQQVLAWASDLRKTLKSDPFCYAVQLLRQDYQNRFFTTALHEREAREQAFRLNAALDDLLSAMQTVVLVAEYQPDEE